MIIPHGWAEAQLDELVEILDSARIPINGAEREARIAGKPAGSLFPYYGATGSVGEIDGFLFDEPLILLGEDGVPFLDPLRHKAYLIHGKCWVNNHAHVLRAINTVADRHYLSGYLNVFDYRGFVTGSTRLKLTQAAMRQIPVVVAPRAEQKRIADKLDAVLARVDACRERLDRVPAILKRFRQTVLAAATSGKLTEDWREERARGIGTNGSSLKWAELPLGGLCDRERVITYGVIKLGIEIPEGVPCLRTSNVRWLRFDTEGIKRIDPALSLEYSRTILKGGEVLVNVRGTLGGVAVATPEMAGWNVSREVAVVPVDTEKLDPAYLACWIGSAGSQHWLGGVKKGVAYIGINIEDLRNLPVRVPSMEEQKEIVRRVGFLHAYADRFEARYAAARAQVERLTPALLAKAFRGELVPQDPSDEPASALLERIRTARATDNAKPKQLKKGRKPPMATTTTETIRAIIQRLPADGFTFDDLRGQALTDYETMKEAIFTLLVEPNSSLKQVFDARTNSMRFVYRLP